MKFNDLVRISIRQVLRYRRRYIGVFLAIGFGVAGFITIITMSRDFKKNFNQDMTAIGGVTCIRVYFENHSDQNPQWFRADTVAALRAMPGVINASLICTAWSYTNSQGRRYPFMVLGVDEFFWTVRGFYPLQGELFGLEAIEGRKREVVLGTELAQKIFGTRQVSGLSLGIGHDIYRVTGLLGGMVDSAMANTAYLPISTAQDRFPGVSLPNRLYLRCLTWDDVANVAAAIPGVIRPYQSTEQLRVEVSWEALRRVKNVAWWVEFFIYLAISATLLLGGVGIWNVMMAAVRSRTREIGLKKAMGAEDRDILAQFLSEALCLSLGGALAGVVLGRLTMEVIGYCIGSHPPEGVFLLCLVVGFLFAVGLGVGAGLYPSIQASRMEVVSAIRYE